MNITPSSIAKGIENDEFFYVYQPKISLITGKISGFEALIRWQRGDKLIMPGSFIETAETSGIISLLTRHMFKKLLTDAPLFLSVKPNLVISFNVTPYDFEDSDLFNEILTTINNHIIQANQLEIEITETRELLESAGILEKLTRLQEHGVSIAMDDYGTGYSSLETFSSWPFTTLKLDKTFIDRISDSQKCHDIVDSSIRMGHKMGLKVIAEGVEERKDYETLMNLGCNEIQGFYIAEGLSVEDAMTFLAEDKTWSGLPVGLIHLAQQDHMEWRQKMIKLVLKIQKEGVHSYNPAECPELDHTKCRLGRWYHSEEAQIFKDSPTFRDLDIPHSDFHKVGQELLEAALAGKSKQEVVKLMQQLAVQSSMVIAMLQHLEDEGLMSATLYANSHLDE